MADNNALVRELIKGTERDALSWEETVREDTFLTTLKSASVTIGLRKEVLTLEVRDVEGRLIERLSTDWRETVQPSVYASPLEEYQAEEWASRNPEEVTTPNPLANDLKRLHLTARRKALDADTKIESLLSELRAS